RVVLEPGADLGVTPRQTNPLGVAGGGRGPRAARREFPLSHSDPPALEPRLEVHREVAGAPAFLDRHDGLARQVAREFRLHLDVHATVRTELALEDLRGLLPVRGDRPLINLDPDGDAHARLAVERGHQATLRFAAAAHFLCTGRLSASRQTTWFRGPWVGIPRPQNAH